MAKLKQLIDPYDNVDPLPTFGLYADVLTMGTVYNSDLQTIGYFRGNPSAQEMFALSSSSATTNGLLGTSNTNHIQSSVMNQAEGNLIFDIGPRQAGGIARNIASTPTQIGNIWHKFGVVIGEPGVRQKFSLWQSDDTLAIHMRGTNVIESVPLAALRTTTSEPGTLGFGQCCYNDRTNTLIAILGATSGSARAHVWVNPRRSLNTALISSGSLRTFITEAFNGTNGASYFYNDFTWNTSGVGNTSESNRHTRVILGDNGKVGLFRHTPSTQAIWANFTLNPSGTTTTVTAMGNNATTTTFGMDTGTYLGSKTNITWDNQWVAAYCQYAHYGAGIILVMFYTKDPSIAYWYVNTANGAGATGLIIVPISSGKFLLQDIQNSDGTLITLSYLDPDGYRKNGRDQAGVAISTTGALITNLQTRNSQLDVTSNTTNYPAILAMSQWWGS